MVLNLKLLYNIGVLNCNPFYIHDFSLLASKFIKVYKPLASKASIIEYNLLTNAIKFLNINN